MRSWLAIAAAVLGACGGAPTDEEVEVHTYRIDAVWLSEPGQRALADIDGDGSKENAAAGILDAVFAIYGGFGLEQTWQQQLIRELAHYEAWIVETRTFAGGGLEVALLDGDGLDAGAPLTRLADVDDRTGVPGWHPVLGVTGGIRRAEEDVIDAWIAGGLAPDYQRPIAEGMVDFIEERATDGTPGPSSEADANDDGQVTIDELLAWGVFSALLEPDLDLVGGDGVRDSLSFGFEIQASEVHLR